MHPVDVATEQDVIERWVASTPPPAPEVIRKWLTDAALLIDAEIPGIAARMDRAEDGLREKVIMAQSSLVMQVLTNPDSVRQTSSTTGPVVDSVVYGAETLGGAMVLTPSLRALLSDTGQGKAFQIDMTPRPTATEQLLFGAHVNGSTAPGSI